MIFSKFGDHTCSSGIWLFWGGNTKKALLSDLPSSPGGLLKPVPARMNQGQGAFYFYLPKDPPQTLGNNHFKSRRTLFKQILYFLQTLQTFINVKKDWYLCFKNTHYTYIKKLYKNFLALKTMLMQLVESALWSIFLYSNSTIGRNNKNFVSFNSECCKEQCWKASSITQMMLFPKRTTFLQVTFVRFFKTTKSITSWWLLYLLTKTSHQREDTRHLTMHTQLLIAYNISLTDS